MRTPAPRCVSCCSCRMVDSHPCKYCRLVESAADDFKGSGLSYTVRASCEARPARRGFRAASCSGACKRRGRLVNRSCPVRMGCRCVKGDHVARCCTIWAPHCSLARRARNLLEDCWLNGAEMHDASFECGDEVCCVLQSTHRQLPAQRSNISVCNIHVCSTEWASCLC